MRALRRDAGRTTFSCRADDALRMRVSMSPIGSVMDMGEVSYQLDLMTPVISPCSARLRKQRRHIWNFRRNARGRPHSGQRLYWRTGNFSLRLACAILESLAIGSLLTDGTACRGGAGALGLPRRSGRWSPP